jgi:pentatricopeptide repeat protein
MSSLITMPSNTNILGLAAQLVVALRVELAVFALALALHFMLFGKQKVTSHHNKHSKDVTSDSGTWSSKAAVRQHSPEPVRTKKLLKIVEEFTSAGTDHSGLAAALARQLEDCQDSEVPSELARMVQALKRPDPQVLQATREVLKIRSLELPESLGAALMSKDFGRQMALIKSFGAAHRLQDAFATFNAVGQDKSSGIYNVMLGACVECQDEKAADQIMQQAIEAGKVDVTTYNVLMKLHINAGRFHKAKGLMDSMRAEGIEPNVVSFNELLGASLSHSREALVDHRGHAGVWPEAQPDYVLYPA